MKIRILIVLFSIFPCIIKAQVTVSVTATETAQKKVVFYNEGQMYVDPKDTSDPANPATVYVQGSIKVGDGSQIKQIGTTSLIGDFINGQNAANVGTNSFNTVFTTDSDGIIRFANTTNATNTPNGRFGASGTQMHKESAEPYLNLLGKLKIPQYIITEGNSSKADQYINFPNVEAEAGTNLILSSDGAASMQTLTTKIGSLFTVASSPGTASNGQGVVDYGHLILNEKPVRMSNQGPAGTTGNTFVDNYSHHMLDIVYYNFEDSAANTIDTQNNSPGIVRNRRLVGVTSPYKKVSNDYFLYHTIFNPGTLWDNFVPYVDPKGYINAGEGYMVSMELSGFDYDVIRENWGTNENLRAAGGFSLSSRFQFEKEGFIIGDRNIKEPVTAYGSLTEGEYREHWEDEAFLSLDASDTPAVPMRNNSKDKFFLANPYMAPLNMGSILSKNTSTPQLTEFGVTAGTDIDANINCKFWILQNSILRYDPFAKKNLYVLKYLSYSGAGATAYLGEKTTEHVGPQQVFVLQMGTVVNDVTTFTFNPSQVAHNSTRTSKSFEEKSAVDFKDEILIQVMDEENGDEDRLAVVLSNKSSSTYKKYGDVYDDFKDDLDFTFKLSNNKNDENTSKYTYRRRAAIYTPSADEVPMRTNGVPTNTKSLPLYVTPTDVPRTLVLRPYRVESLQSVEGAWLEDKQLNTVTQLVSGMEYTFQSTVIGDKNADKNRFVLHFAKVSEDNKIIENTGTPISCRYSNSDLIIRGLNSDDIGSRLEIFDLQGRLMAQTKIVDAPEMVYTKPLGTGTYIVRITGKRNFTTKFMTLQN